MNTLCIIKNKKKKKKDLLFCISLFKERGFYIKVSGLIAKTMYNITDWIKILQATLKDNVCYICSTFISGDKFRKFLQQ